MDTSLFDLSGKTALVTGASSGIGEATARLLAEQGAHVVVTSRKLEACEAVARSIREGGGRAEAMALHVGDRARIREVVARVDEENDGLDILVNNAGVNPWLGPVWETPESVYDKLLEVNLGGVFFASVEAVRRMKERAGGRIVNIGSMSGLRAEPDQAVYGTAKAAVEALTRAMAAECGPLGISVNAVAPGVIETPMSAPVFQDREAIEQLIQQTPMRRHGESSEIATAVLYLVSPAGSFVNGAVLRVDGGIML